MKLCKCGKEKVGYRYCTECAIEAKKIQDAESNKKRRNKRLPCMECGIALTGTKYCKSCAQIVQRRNTLEQNRAVRSSEAKDRKPYKSKNVKREEKITIDPKWLHRNCKHYEGNISL